MSTNIITTQLLNRDRIKAIFHTRNAGEAKTKVDCSSCSCAAASSQICFGSSLVQQKSKYTILNVKLFLISIVFFFLLVETEIQTPQSV